MIFTENQYNYRMPLKNLRRIFGIFVFLASLVILIWGIWPGHERQQQFKLPGANFELSRATSSILPGDYQLQIKWPDQVRAGSVNRIWLRMDPISQSGLNSSIDSAGERSPAVESRLEMAGARFVPEGEISQVLTPGNSLQFSWQIQTSQTGVYPGKIWLHLNTAPAQASGAGNRILLLSQPIEIQSTKLLGLDAYLAQVVGIIGIVLGAALCIDLIVEAFLKTGRNIHEVRSWILL